MSIASGARTRSAPAEPMGLAVPAARSVALLAARRVRRACTGWRCSSPRRHARAWYAVLAAAAAIAGLLAAGAARPAAADPRRVRGRRSPALALALLGGGVADELLRPDRWGELASGIDRGIAALPGARVPYRGLDEWTRTVLGVGGTVIVVAAALLAFWPRSQTLGFRNVALVVLVTLYAVPAVALDFESEFLRGAALALLVLAYLRLETIGIGDAGAAGVLAVAVAVLGLVAAPALDKDAPWWDYETWALSTASAKSTSFSWDHSYGALDWPRDGRELLRVKARRPAYWKALNLDEFNGRALGARHRHAEPGRLRPRRRVRLAASRASAGCRRSGCRVRNLNTRDVRHRRHRVRDRRAAHGRAAARRRRLRDRDAPAAARRRLRRPRLHAGADRARAARWPARCTRTTSSASRASSCPGRAPSGSRARSAAATSCSSRCSATTARRSLARPTQPALEPEPAEELMSESGYRRTYRLAQELKARRADAGGLRRSASSATSGRGFAYTESPPLEAENLEGFLFDAKSGYCQQFSGAMALLLRMGGVPARVSTGFTSGSYDRKTREYVVRDFDAHSWVEVWYSGSGWVTFDPTPASSPARSQPNESDASGLAGGSSRAPDLGGDIRSDPSRRTAAAGEGTPWRLIATGAGLALAALGLGLWLLRRHRRRVAEGWGPLAELERALRRMRRGPRPGTTLRAIEAGLASAPGRRELRARDPRAALRRASDRPDARPAARAARRAGPRRRAVRADPRVVGRAAASALIRRTLDRRMDDVYDLFQRGTALLEAGDYNQATIPLSRARDLDPEKTSIREALGRAYFRSHQFEKARAEFEAVVERAPTNDYALFCLGRSLMQLGRMKEARKPLVLAACLRPERRDYRIYRERVAKTA